MLCGRNVDHEALIQRIKLYEPSFKYNTWKRDLQAKEKLTYNPNVYMSGETIYEQFHVEKPDETPKLPWRGN